MVRLEIVIDGLTRQRERSVRNLEHALTDAINKLTRVHESLVRDPSAPVAQTCGVLQTRGPDIDRLCNEVDMLREVLSLLQMLKKGPVPTTEAK